MHRTTNNTTITIIISTVLLLASLHCTTIECFQVNNVHLKPRTTTRTTSPRTLRPSFTARSATKTDTSNDEAETTTTNKKMNKKEQEYRNAPTLILSNFMNNNNNNNSNNNQEQQETTQPKNPIDEIDFSVPKYNNENIDLETLAQILDYELYTKQWFVTGNVNPVYFAEEFEFQDPDVKLQGIEEYARGVYKLFDQQTSKAEIISTKPNPSISPNTITVTWRLSGKVNIGPGLTIKPYICYTDFTVDEKTGLITFQEDRFDIPQWDILLSSLFPFLIGKVTAEPAPEVEARDVSMPNVIVAKKDSGEKKGGSPFDKILQMFGQ